jgi:BON domain-containing protein
MERGRGPRAETERRRGGGARALLGGALLGAALAFLLDPRLGRRRRALARDRVGGLLRALARRAGRLARSGGAHARGYRTRLFRPPHPERLQPDDATLAHKVETELFRPADVPKGKINVNVQEGVVQLRGEVPQPELIRDLVEKARRVAGVREVENLLHLPGTPPPMHQ